MFLKNSGNELKTIVLLFTPLAVFMVIFIIVPVIGNAINGMYRDVSFLDKQFIWFNNYVRIITDQQFWSALRFTVLFIMVSVSLEVLLGMTIALILNTKLPFRGLVRGCVLIPWVIPSVISGRIWELIYNYSYGIANHVLTACGLADQPLNWLGSSFGAFSSLVIADVWKAVPFAALILLAGLQAIPHDLYLQARIDGAGTVRIFRKITLPLLRPVIIVTLLFRTVDALRIFDIIYVLTGGGPGGKTTSLSLYSYNFYLNGDFGYGSAVSVLLFLIAFGFSLTYIKLGKFKQAIETIGKNV